MPETLPRVIWARSDKVTASGLYNVLAYSTNPNIGYGAKNVPYSLKIYDKDNLLLFGTIGSAYIPSTANFTVFIGSINLGDKIPARIVFEFSNQVNWEKMENNDISIVAISKDLQDENTKPRLAVTLKNNSLLPVKNIEAVAILYDDKENAVAFSRTIVDLIQKDSTEDLVYTWPDKFDSKIYKIDIVSKILPK